MDEHSLDSNITDLNKFIENIDYVKNRKKRTHKYYNERNTYLISAEHFMNLKTLSHDLLNTRYEIISILENYIDLINIKSIVRVLSDDCAFKIMVIISIIKEM